MFRMQKMQGCGDLATIVLLFVNHTKASDVNMVTDSHQHCMIVLLISSGPRDGSLGYYILKCYGTNKVRC